jgi:putative transcriptional regulator
MVPMSDQSDDLIAQYVFGALPEPARILVEAHLEMRQGEGRFVDALGDIAGRALDAIDPMPMTARERKLQAIFQSPPPTERDPLPETPSTQPSAKQGDLPPALHRYLGMDLDEIPWRTRLPGFRDLKVRKTAEIEASLIWVRPGRAMPRHRHKGMELTLVLEGEYADHRGYFRRGDLSIADETLDHRPVAGKPSPCICYSVLFAPVAFSGSRLGLLRDIIGF